MAQDINPDLSIIILNYNVRELLLACLKSIFKNKSKEDNWQVIVSDNASSDNSVEAVKKEFPQVEVVENNSNLGFALGNNVAVPFAKAPVVLFLNPDTEIVGDAIKKSLDYLTADPEIGALTCRVELPDGRLDYSCHRGFPTPWNSFCYFSGLSRLFPRSSFFSGYNATYLDLKTTHEIDCGSGSFLMVRKIAGDQISWWNKEYFWNGEDIEFCFALKEKGWKIVYFADAKIIHYKGSSSGLWTTGKGNVEKSTKLIAARNAAMAMRIFYLKHYFPFYPPVLRYFALWGIYLLESFRIFKIKMGLKYK